MAGREEAGRARSLDQYLDLTIHEPDHRDIARVVVLGGSGDREERGPTPGQYPRRTVAHNVSFGGHRGQRLGRSAFGRHSRQPGKAAGEDDGVAIAPARSARVDKVAQDSGIAAPERDLLQLAIRDETQPLAIRGEEWGRCALGTIEGPGLQLLHLPDVELPRRHESDASPVRREGQRGRVETHDPGARRHHDGQSFQGRGDVASWRSYHPDDRACDERAGKGRRPEQREAASPPRARVARCALRLPIGNKAEHDRDVLCVLPSGLRVLREADAHDTVEGRWGQGLHRGDRRRFRGQDRRGQAGAARARERPPARGHLVEDHPEREHIGPGVHRLALELLGRHVLEGADHRALARERLQGRVQRRHLGRLAPSVALEEPRHPEVQKLGSRPREHDVRGLQVAMDDSPPVRRAERAGNLPAETKHLFRGQRTLRQSLGQGLALHELHHQEGEAVLVAHVVERADVGMVQAGDGSRFTLEPLSHFDGLRLLGGKHLHRHRAIEPRVLRPIDLAHAAAPEGSDDLVRPETAAGFEGHGGAPRNSTPAS